ncbi:hypothetical protein MNBD_GAMMA26-1678 [hydrothermal vent metagenome]|uniref:Transmembrane protein n=1 Tax=hydrothermal vent metagenome TaxID=652676 RepID=A0A3B1AW62_9ZZZZ
MLLLALLLGMLSGLNAVAAPNNAAHPPTAGEYTVKAAFLYHFAKFVEWPVATRSSELTICIVGVDPFGATLDTITGKQVGTAQVSVQRLQKLSKTVHCHIVFISTSEQSRLDSILSDTRDAMILTISEIPGFAEKGGMVLFHMEDSKVRFSINLTAMRSAQLTASGHLLRLARQVYQNEEDNP